jgi:hypothetical protein
MVSDSSSQSGPLSELFYDSDVLPEGCWSIGVFEGPIWYFDAGNFGTQPNRSSSFVGCTIYPTRVGTVSA